MVPSGEGGVAAFLVGVASGILVRPLDVRAHKGVGGMAGVQKLVNRLDGAGAGLKLVDGSVDGQPRVTKETRVEW